MDTAQPQHPKRSEHILEEYREVLARPELKIRRGLRQQLLQLVRSHSQAVKPSRPLQITHDPMTTSSWNASMRRAPTIL